MINYKFLFFAIFLSVFAISTVNAKSDNKHKGKSFKKKGIDEYCFNGSKVNSHKLKRVLIRDGIKEEKCEMCGISEWMGHPVVLELDHIDSNHNNNELENLQILCPNCHASETRKRINDKKIIKPDGRTLRYKRLNLRKVKDRPDLILLKESVKDIGYSATGRLYGVSDNCIRKWIKQGEVLELVDIPVLETGAK